MIASTTFLSQIIDAQLRRLRVSSLDFSKKNLFFVFPRKRSPSVSRKGFGAQTLGPTISRTDKGKGEGVRRKSKE
jgi:hypothetical protein